MTASPAYTPDAGWSNKARAVAIIRKGENAYHCSHQHTDIGKAFDCAATWADRENALDEMAAQTVSGSP